MTYGVRSARPLRVRLLNEEDDTARYKRQGWDPRKTYEENMGYVGVFDRPEEDLEWPSPEAAPARMAQKLAAQGRGEDTEIAHVARGELVLPRALQSPEVLDAIRRAAEAHDIPLDMLKVGNVMNHLNPATGAPEFSVMDWANKLKGQMLNSAFEGVGRVAEKFEREAPATVILPLWDVPLAPLSNSELDYDPNGPSLWNLMKNDPVGAGLAGWHATRAWQEARDRYEGGPAEASLYNGDGDAWRHARWNQRMVNSIGPERAKAFADWNERKSGESNPAGERAMDLCNNHVGQNLAGDNSKLTIDDLVRRKRLRRTPY